jgi:hypothetical protein
MDNGVLIISILDSVLLIIGVFMSVKKVNKKHTDIVWKLVEYVTMALVGYLLGTGRVI